ncbi:hypothetical protein K438DRAFT_1973510 [Mycena galopus ATCC 62051]|nr:hypothetical protein K438DRAFT_1973510 [Mycena galopus ATCC 62051]
MRLVLYFRFFGVFAALSLVSGQLNVTLDDTDTSIVYSDGWNVSTTKNSLDFGGFLHFSANSTASASVTFRGVAVYLLSPFWSASVGAQVVIDGQGPFVIDLEDYGVVDEPGLGREILRSQVVWAATDLSDKNHTMVISMPPGTQYVVLDGLIYTTNSDANDTQSVPTADTSTSSSSSTTTIITTTTNPITLSSSAPGSSFIQSTTSSSFSSTSSNLLPSSVDAPASQYTNPAVNVGNAPSSSVPTPSVAAAVTAVSTNSKRSIVIGSVLAAMVLVLVLVVLTCLRRRRIRRRSPSYTWSQKFAPPTSHAARIATRPVASHQAIAPFLYQPSPSPTSTVPLLSPVVPAARRVPRSPLATARPITPLFHAAEFPMPPAIHTSHPLSPAYPMSPAPATPRYPASPAPTTPLPMTPLPPATPGTPWTTTKSHRLSGSSTYSYDSSAVESGIGYGWTRPSLVGIHPFSAPAEPQPVASGSSSAAAKDGAATKLVPKLSEKSAEALFHAPQRISAAPAYREKDAARAFKGARALAENQTSETAPPPPVYEP